MQGFQCGGGGEEDRERRRRGGLRKKKTCFVQVSKGGIQVQGRPDSLLFPTPSWANIPYRTWDKMLGPRGVRA